MILRRSFLGGLGAGIVAFRGDSAWRNRSAAAMTLPAPIWNVTRSTAYPTISAAIKASNHGDTILIKGPGVHTEDYPNIVTNITLQSVGGLVQLRTPSLVNGIPGSSSPYNGKAVLVIPGFTVTIDGFEFAHVAVGGGNGAGIRNESNGTVTIRNCWFHDCQDGLLGATNLDPRTSHLIIDHCQFNNNGAGDGYTHNLYCGDCNSLSVTNSLFYAAHTGHEIKSRSTRNTIYNNRIFDGPAGDASYCIDLPNGTSADIQYNIIEKGINSPNDMVIHFGGEVPNPIPRDKVVTIRNNVVIYNHQIHSSPQHQSLFFWDQGLLPDGSIQPITIAGNVFFGLGPEDLLAGPLASDTKPLAPFAYPVNQFYPIGQQPAPLDYSTPIRSAMAEVPRPAPAPRTQRPVRKL
jgi:hypothetical protein